MSQPASVLVIGLGNRSRGDDGVGLEVARRLERSRRSNTRVILAHADLVSLLDLWQGAAGVIVVDAMHSGSHPGTVRRFDARVKPMLGSQFGVSSHAVGLAEVIELGRVLKQLPPHLSVVGIEGADFRPGAGLSPAVARAVPKAVRLVRALLTGLVSNQS